MDPVRAYDAHELNGRRDDARSPVDVRICCWILFEEGYDLSSLPYTWDVRFFKHAMDDLQKAFG